MRPNRESASMMVASCSKAPPRSLPYSPAASDPGGRPDAAQLRGPDGCLAAPPARGGGSGARDSCGRTISVGSEGSHGTGAFLNPLDFRVDWSRDTERAVRECLHECPMLLLPQEHSSDVHFVDDSAYRDRTSNRSSSSQLQRRSASSSCSSDMSAITFTNTSCVPEVEEREPWDVLVIRDWSM